MGWLRNNLGAVVTILVVIVTAAIAWGRMDALCHQVQEKADREAVVRELDQIHATLTRIEDKVDGLAQSRRD